MKTESSVTVYDEFIALNTETCVLFVTQNNILLLYDLLLNEMQPGLGSTVNQSPAATK